MRVFIGINLPEEIKQDLGETQKKFSDIQALSFTNIKNLHITLKFLGEIEEEKLKTINDRISTVASKHKQFSCNLTGCGVFPNEDYIRIVWAGLDCGGCLAKLQKDIDNSLEDLGFEKEKDFVNHITIARTKYKPDKSKLIEILNQLKTHKGRTFNIKEVQLMKSTLTQQGPIYETLKTFKLEG